MHTTASWNHVNNSSPSQFEGATYNNVNNDGAHGFSEILYAYCSATANNGSAFAGITGNTPYYNTTLGIAMLIGRFLMMIPLLAMAGSLVRKKVIPESAGTLATTIPDLHLFAGLRGADHRRAGVLPLAGARPGGGASADVEWATVLASGQHKSSVLLSRMSHPSENPIDGLRVLS